VDVASGRRLCSDQRPHEAEPSMACEAPPIRQDRPWSHHGPGAPDAGRAWTGTSPAVVMVKDVTTTKAARVRAGLDHPVATPTANFVELAPVLDDALLASLEEQGGSSLRDRYLASRAAPFDTSTVLAGRSQAVLDGRWKAMPSGGAWQTPQHP